MIPRRVIPTLVQRIDRVPAVALLGPRQVGKTTLALSIGAQRESLYLDLESETDRAKLADAETYLARHADRLVILDEVQRAPNLFQSLRGLIDQGRREGRRAGRFLLLGSASLDLMRQSTESLAGRLSTVELGPIDATELPADQVDTLWVRGGFPDSLLAANDEDSLLWRFDFIRTYLERDVPQLGPRIPAETLRRFWTMLAHRQGGLLNAAELARGLGVDGKTVASYLDLLVDLLLVRRLEPWHENVGKRLVKSPKLFIRDTGLVHALLGIRDRETLLGHPVVGGSWEGLVVETLAASAPPGSSVYHYRTAAGAEVDLVIVFADGRKWAVEVKRSMAPKVERGFHSACVDLEPEHRWLVYPGTERFTLAHGVEAIGLRDLALLLAGATDP